MIVADGCTFPVVGNPKGRQTAVGSYVRAETVDSFAREVRKVQSCMIKFVR